MDSGKMLQLFQNELPICDTESWRITECRIQHPRYKTYLNPNSKDKFHLALAYHLKGINKHTRQIEEKIIYAKAFLGERSRSEYDKARLLKDEGMPENVFHLSRHGLVAWLFPYDPMLASLPKILNLEFIRPYFAALLLADQAGVPCVITKITIGITNYRPEIRCTCRYDIHRLSRLSHTVYSKTYSAQQGEEVFRRMVFLHQRMANSAEDFVIPKPLAYDGLLRTVWMEGLAGKAVIQAINTDIDWSLITKIARYLAGLHAVKLDGLPTIRNEEHLPEIRKKAEKLKQALPASAARIDRLFESLAQRQDQIPDCEPCLIHGDFHVGQLLLLENGRIALFDYDELAVAHPFTDAANFCADLYNHGFGEYRTRLIIDHFINAYLSFSSADLNLAAFTWHLQLQLLTRAYRAFNQQKPDLAKTVDILLTAAEHQN